MDPWAPGIRASEVPILMDRVVKRYPAVPLYKMKKQRRSAADLVGQAFGLGERQAARIHQTTGELALKLAEFFAWPVGIENGDKRKRVVCP
jgi:hypothetical protein